MPKPEDINHQIYPFKSSRMNIADTSFGKSLILAREEGDLDRQAQILENFRPFLNRNASRLLGKKYSKLLDVSDLVQGAVIRALRDFSNCRASNELEFKAWLRKLLTNYARNQVRYLKQAKRDIGREKSLSHFGSIADRQLSPLAQVTKKEDEQRLLVALKKLSKLDQQVVQLRNQERLMFAEIGKIMNRSEDSARMLWNRAIRKLYVLIQNGA